MKYLSKSALSACVLAICLVFVSLGSTTAQELKPLSKFDMKPFVAIEGYLNGKANVEASPQFSCTGTTCYCDSAADCSDMLDTGLCIPGNFACGARRCACMRQNPHPRGVGGIDEPLDRILP